MLASTYNSIMSVCAFISWIYFFTILCFCTKHIALNIMPKQAMIKSYLYSILNGHNNKAQLSLSDPTLNISSDTTEVKL